MKRKILCFVLCIITSLCLCSCKGEKEYSETIFSFDTFITISAYGENSRVAVEDCCEEIRRIESVFSAHNSQSELSLINQNAHLGYEMSDEVKFVLQNALNVCRLTDGAFDITVGPLCKLWDTKSENPTVPTDEKIQKAKALTGYKMIKIEDNKIFFEKEGMSIDLGGCVKGYAADRCAQILDGHGIKSALLDLGGNVYALGSSPKGKAWRIGLQDPSGQRGEYFYVAELVDSSCVTSGSYERFFEKDGRIYHHIIDPRTGYPADSSSLISASVISQSSFEADMLSTAVFVMGKENFEKIKDNFDFEKIITVDSANRPGFIE